MKLKLEIELEYDGLTRGNDVGSQCLSAFNLGVRPHTHLCANCGDPAFAHVAHHESSELIFEDLCRDCHERGDEILFLHNSKDSHE